VNLSQSTAAAVLGMPPLLMLRRIMLPQAMRAILPALANQTISLIKGDIDRLGDLRQRTDLPGGADSRAELPLL
jgi:hypothetical protein